MSITDNLRPLPNIPFQTGRIVLGLALMISPGNAARRFLGNSLPTSKSKMVVIGARDIILGSATIAEQWRSGNRYRLLLLAGVGADLADCLISTKGNSSKINKTLITALAAGAAVNGLLLLKASYQEDPLLLP